MTRHHRPLRILTVCTFNRVRSVAMTAFIEHGLVAEGIDARVMGAGFMEPDREPTVEAVTAMAELGVDISHHRSRCVSKAIVHGADLVVTAERLHVMRLCEDDGAVFARTFTLPEFVTRAERAGARGDRPMAEWLADVGADRTPSSFLTSGAREIPDPTGMAPIVVAASMADIRDWCNRLVRLL